MPAFASHASSVTISSSASTFIVGQSVTVTATVSPSNATGTVQFLLSGTNLGSPVVLASGQAIFLTASLPVGTDNISASYSGNSNFNPSTSNSVPVAVTTNSGGSQPGNDLSSATNLGQLVSDFVHARNTLLKEERNQSLAVIHECKVEIRNASYGDRKQIEADCKLKLKESNQNFKDLQKQLKQEFEQLKAKFKSANEHIHKQQANDENNETQNSDKQISFQVGNMANHGNGSGKHMGGHNSHEQHGHKDKKHEDN